jgi:hypothetical protein
MGRLVLSSLPSREYHNPDYEDGRVTRHIYALRRRFFADSIELHVFRSTEEVISPSGYKVVARVERDAAANWPRWAQEAVERHAARRRPGAGLPFGPGHLCEENGLYKGPVLLYRPEQAGGFNFTGVAARPGDQPVASEGYVLLPEEPMVLWGEAAEREVALNRLLPLGPFVPNVSWDDLPQAFMAMDSDHWGLLGNSLWVQRGEPRGFSDNLLEAEQKWDQAIAVEPVEGQPKPPLRTKLDGWVTVLCLFAGISAKLEGLLKAGIRIRKLLVVEIDPVARRILKYRVRVLHRRYPNQLPAVACEGLLTALPADIRLVGSPELGRFMPIHMVTVSSPCQGLSRANRNGRGLADPRSKLISEAWRILGYLSRHQTIKPAYTFEMARDHPSQDARNGFTIIDRVAGGAVYTAIVIEAAKLGSAAHRIRAFWTNAAPSRILKQRYAQFDREWVNDRKEAQDVLCNGRRVNTAPADDPDIKGYYWMNFKGDPIRVFPTLVSTPQSFAFRRQEGGPIPGRPRPGPGMVYDPEMRGWMEPTADERELIMGCCHGQRGRQGSGKISDGQRLAAPLM